MCSILPFDRTSAKPQPLPAVTQTSSNSYILGRPCTVRAIEKDRFALFVWHADTDKYEALYACDTRRDADEMQYQVVNRSEYLVAVDTCQQCWAVLPLTGERVRRGQMLFCSHACEAKYPNHRAAAIALRLGVMAAIVVGLLGFWYAAAECIFKAVR